MCEAISTKHKIASSQRTLLGATVQMLSANNPQALSGDGVTFRLVDEAQFLSQEAFDNYAAGPGEPNGWVGRKTAYVDELLVIPVPEDSVRADGVITGEYHFGELLNPDSYDSLKSNSNVDTYIVKPYFWSAIHFNKNQGMFTDLKMRKAFKLAIDLEPGWRAAWGKPEFWRLQPAMGAPETPWYTEVRKGEYNKKDPDQAKALLKEAGYKGETVRWLTTKAQLVRALLLHV